MKSPYLTKVIQSSVLLAGCVMLLILNTWRKPRPEETLLKPIQEPAKIQSGSSSIITAPCIDSDNDIRIPIGTHTGQAAAPILRPFPEDWRLCSLVRDQSGATAGFYDRRYIVSFTMKKGEVHRGLTLVTANFDEESVSLMKGDEMWILKLCNQEETVSQKDLNRHSIPRQLTGGIIGVEGLTQSDIAKLSKGEVVAVSPLANDVAIPEARAILMTQAESVVVCETPKFNKEESEGLAQGGLIFASRSSLISEGQSNPEGIGGGAQIRACPRNNTDSLSEDDMNYLLCGGLIYVH